MLAIDDPPVIREYFILPNCSVVLLDVGADEERTILEQSFCSGLSATMEPLYILGDNCMLDESIELGCGM